jgi:hypothetical protein
MVVASTVGLIREFASPTLRLCFFCAFALNYFCGGLVNLIAM